MFRSTHVRLAASAAVLLSLFAWAAPSPSPHAPPDAGPIPARNRYIGADACKNCHSGEARGAQYHTWSTKPHAKAWDTLGAAEAKKIAKGLGIDDPQKSAKCLQCHVTAHGEKKSNIKRGFKAEQGVQCESCHGPGEEHAKTRFKEASSGRADPARLTKIPDDEIIKHPKPDACRKCHNEKSPTFKEFCFKEHRAKIAHLDPRIKRTPAEMKALETGGEVCTCKKCKEEAEKQKKGDGK